MVICMFNCVCFCVCVSYGNKTDAVIKSRLDEPLQVEHNIGHIDAGDLHFLM